MDEIIKAPRFSTREEILSPVKMVEAKSLNSDLSYTSKNEYCIIVETKNGLKKVNDCSADYKLISNQQVIEPFEEELKKKYKFNAAYQHHDYSKFFIRYDINMNEQTVNGNDKLIPSLKVHTSYNGELKHQIHTGCFRLLSQTGLVLPVWEEPMKFKHSKNMSEEFARQIIMEKIELFVNNFQEYIKIYDPLFENEVDNHTERIEKILKSSHFPKRQLNEIIIRAEEELVISKQKKMTDWLIYNAFNYQLNFNDKIGFHEDYKEVVDKEILNYILNGKITAKKVK